MKILNDVKRFISAKSNDDERAEVRAYLLENAEELAVAFGVEPDVLRARVEELDDDRLVSLTLGQIADAKRERRYERAEARALDEQSAADRVGGSVQWSGEVATVDIATLLASAVSRRMDLLVFTCTGFTVAVRMAPLVALARLKRGDLSARVDAHGLHIRWNDGKGGLNLRPQTDPRAEKIVVNLSVPAVPGEAVAA